MKLKSLIEVQARASYEQHVGRPPISSQISDKICRVDTKRNPAKVAGVSCDTIAKADAGRHGAEGGRGNGKPFPKNLGKQISRGGSSRILPEFKPTSLTIMMFIATLSAASSVAHGNHAANNSHSRAYPLHRSHIASCSSHNANVSQRTASWPACTT
jgi:hypothetical protein